MGKRDPVETMVKIAEIRKDIEQGSYLNPIKARNHIKFLLGVCEDLTEAISRIRCLFNKTDKEGS